MNTTHNIIGMTIVLALLWFVCSIPARAADLGSREEYYESTGLPPPDGYRPRPQVRPLGPIGLQYREPYPRAYQEPIQPEVNQSVIINPPLEPGYIPPHPTYPVQPIYEEQAPPAVYVERPRVRTGIGFVNGCEPFNLPCLARGGSRAFLENEYDED